MLNIKAIQHPQERHKALADFRPQTDLWLVIDLDSKKRIQDILRTKHKGFHRNCVLRLEDFWSQELFRHDPTWKIISYPLLQLEADFFLQEFSLDWMKGRNGAKKLVSLFDTLGPYVLHPHLEPLLEEWLEKNPEAQIRWRHLWEAVKRFAPRLFEKKWLTTSLIPHLLLEDSYSHRSSYRKIILDSGFSLRPAEYLIFERLAKTTESDWLKPQGEWFSDEGYWSGERKLQMDISAMPSADVRLIRFHSQLAETKNVVAELRASLESGRPLQDHHLYLLEAETQWPALRWHMKKEGLPWQAQPMKLHGFQSVQRWLATLRSQNPWALFTDQELSRFAMDDLKESYDWFARKNRNIEYWAQHEVYGDLMNAEEFFGHWLKENQDSMVNYLVQKAMTDFPAQWRLSFSQWVHYLENLAMLTEVQAEEEKRWNVSLPLQSAYSFVPNLHQDLQKDKEETDIPLSHLQMLRRDLGWPVDGADSTQLEANLRWLAQDPDSQVVISYAEKDFMGAYKIPHRLFTIWSQQESLTNKKSSISLSARWNELQDSLKNSPLPDVNASFKVDPEILKKEKKNYLSPSALEKYEECAFMLVAERHLRLSNSPDYELDLDHVTRGRVQHALFEKILKTNQDLWDDEQRLIQLMDEAFDELDVDFVDESFKEMMRLHYLQLIKTFIQQEREYRQKHPKNKTVAVELEFELPLSEEFKVRGRIDRVDSDSEGNYWVSDYKSSAAELNNWQKWMEKGEYQLAAYASAIEDGGTKLPTKEVLASTYIVVRDDSREKGLFFEEGKEAFFDSASRAKGRIDKAEWTKLKTEMQARWLEIFNKYRDGNLAPLPEDIKSCDDCLWRGLCRATHL